MGGSTGFCLVNWPQLRSAALTTQGARGPLHSCSQSRSITPYWLLAGYTCFSKEAPRKKSGSPSLALGQSSRSLPFQGPRRDLGRWRSASFWSTSRRVLPSSLSLCVQRGFGHYA